MNMDWHLNKSVAISIIFLLLTNIGSTIWFLSSINSDVDALKARPDLLERVIKLEGRSNEYGRILTRIDNTLDTFNTTLSKVSNELARRTPFADAVEKQIYKRHDK